MSAAIEILAPTSPDKLKKAMGTVQKTQVVRAFSRGVRERMLVAWISDLDVDKRRQKLAEMVEFVVKETDGVPFILIDVKTTKPRSYRTLSALTRWSSLSGFYLAPGIGAVRRMVKARLAGAETKLMASAFIDGDRLIVWTCEPRRLVVPVSKIPALADMPAKDLNDFELSEAGSRLHWNKDDVDLDLESIRYYVDPEVRREHDRARREEAASYTGAIRAFREERGLKQTDIPGLTERQVRRVEQGENMPRSTTLKRLAAAHELSLDQYLKELAKRSGRK
jgi:hypothetical protein